MRLSATMLDSSSAFHASLPPSIAPYSPSPPPLLASFCPDLDALSYPSPAPRKPLRGSPSSPFGKNRHGFACSLACSRARRDHHHHPLFAVTAPRGCVPLPHPSPRFSSSSIPGSIPSSGLSMGRRRRRRPVGGDRSQPRRYRIAGSDPWPCSSSLKHKPRNSRKYSRNYPLKASVYEDFAPALPHPASMASLKSLALGAPRLTHVRSHANSLSLERDSPKALLLAPQPARKPRHSHRRHPRGRRSPSLATVTPYPYPLAGAGVALLAPPPPPRAHVALHPPPPPPSPQFAVPAPEPTQRPHRINPARYQALAASILRHLNSPSYSGSPASQSAKSLAFAPTPLTQCYNPKLWKAAHDQSPDLGRNDYEGLLKHFDIPDQHSMPEHRQSIVLDDYQPVSVYEEMDDDLDSCLDRELDAALSVEAEQDLSSLLTRSMNQLDLGTSPSKQ
ncbi:uncharacterized protein BJ171DRAFT_308989 [Polychytrium aggregatum]|uniref:uncharacterized protein n=1 Tax=Polychytrium aggregatum TaxID=110093 RepID=UPI0022FEB1DE|nr:uncharacterized protein BJ171DRAFT_308989 [Polychytrium aggregatum]KAI9206922.1 hypothetical protein BJ171DRAFT_308989 [Polychytrium aggregatum]